MNDPKVQELKDKIMELKDEIREHSTQTDDPKCAALCETSAEVLQGLETAFAHFQEGSESAWQESDQESDENEDLM